MANEQTCYFPDGSASPRDSPCHSPSFGDGASACCASSDICLNNSLCLAQTGAALISRGTCTDKTWQDPACPQYCADVSTNAGVNIHVLDIDNDQFRPLFCCSQVEPSNNTCRIATKGSTSPFYISAGLVIFNRTSGSTSPNATHDATVTITATATVTTTATTLAPGPSPIENTSSSASVSPSSSQSSSTKEAAIGAGVGGALGLALLIALVLLWRQRKQKQGLTKDVNAWEGKYRDSMAITASGLGGSDHQPSSAGMHGWGPGRKDGQFYPVSQLEGWKPDEIDGAEIHEIANQTRGESTHAPQTQSHSGREMWSVRESR